MELKLIDGMIHAEGSMYDDDGSITLKLNNNHYVNIDSVCEWITKDAKWYDYSHDEIDLERLASDLRKVFEPLQGR